MSAQHSFPAGAGVFLLSASAGVLTAGGCLAGMAQMMAAKGCSAAIAPLLATVCVCAGSFVSGAAASFCQKERGLLNGLLQGAVLGGVLALLALFSGAEVTSVQGIRIAAVLACGGTGGFAGMMLCERKRRRRG